MPRFAFLACDQLEVRHNEGCRRVAFVAVRLDASISHGFACSDRSLDEVRGCCITGCWTATQTRYFGCPPIVVLRRYRSTDDDDGDGSGFVKCFQTEAATLHLAEIAMVHLDERVACVQI